MKLILIKEGSWEVVKNKSAPESETPEFKDAWENLVDKALATVQLGLSDDVLQHVLHCNTAIEALEVLA